MYYELYIDVLFLTNFLMDYIVLLLAWKILKAHTSFLRIALGALLGAAITCVAAALPASWPAVRFFLYYGLTVVCMARAGLQVKWGRPAVKAAAVLYAGGFLTGGIMEHLGQYVEVGSLFFLLALACYYIASGVLALLSGVWKRESFRCAVRLYYRGKCVEIPAIIDTGNRLRDPWSRKPVSIMEKEVADELFAGHIPAGIRYIPCRTVGKRDGVLPVVQLDAIQVDGERVDAPLAGICEDVLDLNGEYRMIIHPDL